MFLVLFLLAPVGCVPVVVVTTKGSVVGEMGVGYTTFFGVPYAKINESSPFENTSDYNFYTLFNASDPNIMCPQVVGSGLGILQCLRLNIYVPSTNPSRGLPVFVWFHGGGFVMGSAGQYNPKSLTKHGVIVVTANYRLGPYGFLCANGIRNQGLEDQKTALRWIKANIKAFGGDPSNVTVGGQSYGGGAVDFHLHSNEILFNKAIIESGSKFVVDIVSRRDDNVTIVIARRLGSKANKVKEAMLFLNKANPIEVMKAAKELNLRFRVCVDAERDEDGSNYAERLKNTRILIGYNSKEDFARFANQNDTFYKNLSDMFNATLNRTFANNIPDIVKDFYLGGKNISKDSMMELIDFSSDFHLNSPVERCVRNYLMLEAIVYKYLFSYTGGSVYKDMIGVGAYHTEELRYIFDTDSGMKFEEQLMMNRMTTLWANFIKFGDPTPQQTKLLPVKWKATDLITKSYLNIDVNMELLSHVYHQRMAFWELLWSLSTPIK